MHLLKRNFLLVCCFVLFLTGCSKPYEVRSRGGYESVEHVGKVPDEFKEIVEKNLFNGVTAFDGRLLKSQIISEDEENRTVIHQVKMIDTYGNELAVTEWGCADVYHVTTLTATEDGGFLFVLGFRDCAYDNMWASDNGYASRVIKCDSAGNLQFDTSLDSVEGAALKYCFEKDGKFYFFGELETPETKTRGVHSPTDIYMVILDKDGKVLKNQCIAGSDYDDLDMAELSGDSFVLSLSSQSDDGDFANLKLDKYPENWVVVVNDNLEIIEKAKKTGRDYFDYKLGEKNGVPLYKSDELLNDFDAGEPEAFIDYGDFYLIVSENITGIYEKTPPMISATWFYTETVYSAYNYDGELLFRTSMDSSPDYDAQSEIIDEKFL